MKRSQLKKLTKFVLQEISLPPSNFEEPEEPEKQPPEDIQNAQKALVNAISGMLSMFGVDTSSIPTSFRDESGFSRNAAAIKDPISAYKMSTVFWKLMIINFRNSLIALIKKNPQQYTVVSKKLIDNKDYLLRFINHWESLIAEKEMKRYGFNDIRKVASLPHISQIVESNEEIRQHLGQIQNQYVAILNNIIGMPGFKSVFNIPGAGMKGGHNENWINAHRETQHMIEIFRELQIELRNYFDLLNKAMRL